MKNINLNRKKYIGLCVLCSLVMLFTGCKDDTKIPSEFFPEQFFVVETGHELNIDTKSSFDIIINASSSWEASTNVSWCHLEKSLFSGRDTLTVAVDANRGTEERCCYIKINTFFKDNPVIDSVLVIQPVNTLPALEVSPMGDREVFYKGTEFDLNVLYNYGVDFRIDYLAGGEGWIKTTPASFEDSEAVIEVPMHVTVEPNMEGTENREADLIFVNRQDQNVCKIHITQNFPIPAILGFSDDFQTATTTGQPYVKDGWTFQSNPNGTLLFKQFNNSAQALLINGSTTSRAEGFAIFPVFNIADMQNKVFSYTWGAGNKNPALDGDVFQLVGSLDYEGDAFSAHWEIIQDLTNTAEAPAISLPNKKVEVNLGTSKFANEKRVYLALRYVGGGHAYRFDNLKIGNIE